MIKKYTANRQIAATYNFATDGGALGTHFVTALQLPSNCLLIGGYVIALTPLTSAGAPTLNFGDSAAVPLHLIGNIDLGSINAGNIIFNNINTFVGGWQSYLILSAGAPTITIQVAGILTGIVRIVVKYNQSAD